MKVSRISLVSACGLWASSLFVMPIAAHADGPYYGRSPQFGEPFTTWTGCYAGLNIGGAWQKNNSVDVTAQAGGVGSNTGTGVVGGGQLGCDYQFSNNWVIGVQGLYDGGRVDGHNQYTGVPTETLGNRTDVIGTFTARLGYTVSPSTLLYAKGGVAWVNTKFSDVDPTQSWVYGQTNTTRSGWTVGTGLEYKISPNWSAFLDYNYIDVGGHNNTLNYTDGSTYTYRDSGNLQNIMVGINYRFHSY